MKNVRPVAAFTLVEVMVGVGVTCFLFLALCSGLTYGFSKVKLARENLRATQIALEKMEICRMYSWDQINTAGFIPTNWTAPFYPALDGITNQDQAVYYYGTTAITSFDVPNLYSNDLRLVLVTVRWTNSTTHERQMGTVISQYGVERYVF